MKYIVVLLFFTLLLTGCYEGRGYAYDHLNDQDPGALRKDASNRIEESADNDTVGGVYGHLTNNLCSNRPVCCGDITREQQRYIDIQERAKVEKNSELCQELPAEPFIVDCPNEPAYSLYDKEVCLREARR